MQYIRRQKVRVAILSLIVLALTIQPSYSYSEFTDITNHWAKDYIKAAVNKGIVTGYSDGTFRPDAPVTRSELAKIINRGLRLTQTTQLVFSDLSMNQWYYYDASRAVAAGYMQGYDDFTFRGTWNISRQEAAVVYHTLMPFYQRDIGMKRFSDDAAIALWAKESAMAVVDKGYMIGDEQGRFRPEDPLTRAEACVSIVKFLNGERLNSYNQYINEVDDLESNTIFTGKITVDEDIDEGDIFFDRMVSLGDVYVESDQQSEVVFHDSKIQRVWLDNSSGEASIRLTGNTTIEQVIIPYGGTVQDDTLTGAGIQEIVLSGKKLDEQPTYIRGKVDTVRIESEAILRLEAGRVESMRIHSSAKDSVIFQEQATIIEEAMVNSPVSFEGLGKVITMHAQSNYITYQTEPFDVQHSISLRRPPRFAEDDSAPIPVFSPSDDEDNVATDTEIWIVFDEPIFLDDGEPIYNEDIKDLIELRRDRSKGRHVSYTGTLQGDNQSIKLIPEYELIEDEDYYIILLDEVIEDRDGNENDKIISQFRTGETQKRDWDIDIYPKNNARNVDRDIEIEIDFNQTIFRTDGEKLRENDLDELIEIRRGSIRGKRIDFEGYLDRDHEVITLEPTERLDRDTYYYVIILDEVFEDEDYNVLDREWFKFETE